MNSYRIIPTEGATWRLDTASFANHMRRTWPHADIDPLSTSSIALSWEITWEPNYQQSGFIPFVVGTLSQDLQSIFIMGDFDACFSFALWYRTVVPSEHRLFFQDDSLAKRLDLLPNTTKQQIFESFSVKLSQMEWRILQILDTEGGKIYISRLIDMLRDNFIDTSDESFLEQADESVNILWKQSLISSPATKWMLMVPKEIRGVFSSEDFRQAELSLTDIGRRALKAIQDKGADI